MRTRVEAIALAYLALPTVVFLAGWIVVPIGPVAAVLVAIAVLALAMRRRSIEPSSAGPSIVPVVVVATAWCVIGGIGHFVFANPDWVVRDAVLVDLVGKPWPVTYAVDGVATLMRAPIGYFLPAAVVGRLFGIRVAEYALLVWTVVGVALVFAMMLRDRPSPKATAIRLAIFIAFSGMDIVGQIAHYKPYSIGDHLEWWAFLFQYSSITTQLFWVPNHALPGWIAIAWLLGQDPRRLPVGPAILFVAFAPLWSPLTTIGIAPIVGVALLRQWAAERSPLVFRALLDWRMVVPVVACVALVFPYLVAGSDKVASGMNASVPFVGGDIVPRYIEFVLFEFAGFAALLLLRDRRDPLLWAAIGVLLALPVYRFGPYNDLAMRASIPALALLAIRMGAWLSTPYALTRDPRARAIAVVLLVVGAVTPFMEVARVFMRPPWDLDQRSSLIDVTRGTHYLTPSHQPWLDSFLRHAEGD
jgi:hypothetical protein